MAGRTCGVMSERDYYGILGLTADADGTTVNKAYWNLARKYQALATSDPRAHSMLDELNEAYGVLGTPALRDQYDADRPEPASGASPVESYGSGGRKAFVAPSARDDEPARRDRDFRGAGSLASYAAGVALAAIGAGLGLWTGNVLLALLAVMAGAAVVVAPARHKFLTAWRTLADEPMVDATSPTARSAKAANLFPHAEHPLSASIVRRRGLPADELRTSTASMVGRWRASAVSGGREAERGPDSTLVDIFRSEKEVEALAEPLSAVLDVLRGSRNAVESR